MGRLYLPARGSPDTAAVVMHPRGDFLRHYLAPGLAGAGYAFLAANSRYLRNDADALHERLAAWTSQFPDPELAERLQSHGVAAAPVLDVADLLHDPHYRARKTFIEVTHPLGFRETIYGSYIKPSRSVVKMRPGPTIGQDHDHVLKEILGLSERRVRQLIADEVIY